MTEAPLVSVVIPTYNRAGVICRTIDNVLAQTYRNTEIIVVDDGSTDDTQAKLRSYGGRIRVIAQSNAGPAAARNRGIEAATGDLIAFQDSDDLWLPNKLERQAAAADKGGGGSCVLSVQRHLPIYRSAGVHRVSSGRGCFRLLKKGIWTNVAEVWATRFVLFCQTVMIRRECWRELADSTSP